MALVLIFIVSISYILFIQKIEKNWGSFLFVCGVFWGTLTFLAGVALRKEYEWGYKGILWIYINFFALAVMYYVGKRSAKREYIDCCKNEPHMNGKLSNSSWVIIKILTLLGIIKWLYEVILNGFSVQDFLSVSALAQMNNSMAVERYSGRGLINIITQMLNVAVYAAPCCGGFAVVFAENKKQKIWAYMTLLPILLVLLLTNVKAGFVGAICLWLVSFLISYLYRYKSAPKLNVKLLGIILGIVMFFLGITMFSMMLRMGSVNQSTFEAVIRKYLIYAFGEIQSFDIWLSDYFTPKEFSFGTQTFIGIFNTLGIVIRNQGVYSSVPESASNVFTVFRGVIQDFGTFFGTIFISIHGLLAGYCTKKIEQSKKIPVISCVLLLSIYFFFLYGYFVSPWSYISHILALIVFAVYLTIAKGYSVRIVFGDKVIWR